MAGRTLDPRRRLLLAALAAALVASTPAAPALAQQQSLAGLSARDRQVGAQSRTEIVQEFGGVVSGPLADYVRSVAVKVGMASVPGSQAADWTVTVLDSPIPNAMATPGGYLYITRGLLAMINNEAELASVLGHEAGHVAARHSNKRNSRATIGALGSIAASILLGSDAGNLVNTGSSALVAGYSRNQEREADTLGMRYALQAGYDPNAAATMLAGLDRVAAVEGQSGDRTGTQSIFSTHPVTAERVQRVQAQARATGRHGALNQHAFLSAINGMAYGDAADQGRISGTSFRHASLRLGFDAPAGFVLQNSPQAVTGQRADGARFAFTSAAAQPVNGAPASLRSITDSVWTQLAGRLPQISYAERQIGGYQAAVSAARVRDTRGQTQDVGVNVLRLPGSPQVYLLRTIAPAGRGSELQGMVNSFRHLSEAEAAKAASGLHIKVVTVAAGDTADSLARRMAAPYNRVNSLLALNGITAADIRPGLELKLIVG